MTTQTEIDALAALLDGTIAASSVTAEIAALAGLANNVSTHSVVPLPTASFVQTFRGELLQQVAASQAAAVGAAATGGGSTAGALGVTGVASQLTSIIAAVAAASVLAGAGVAAASPNAAPGDALYEAKRLIEDGRLLVGDTQRQAELLLGYATERVFEAGDLSGVAVINELLDSSNAQLAEALALLDTLGLDIADPLLADFAIVHGQALIMLLEGSPSDAITARVHGLLAQTGSLMPARPIPVLTPDVDPSGDAPAVTATDGDEPGDSDSAVITDSVSDSVSDSITDDVGESVTDQSPDAGQDVSDVVEDVTDVVEDVVDEVVTTPGTVNESVTPAVEGLRDTVKDVIGG
ncbi:MAG: hypothetical protein ACJA2H_000420 [Nitriliruptoraceae bacterium]|jgi:hypothetical protein